MPGERRGEGDGGDALGRGLQVGEMCERAERPVGALSMKQREEVYQNGG